MAYKALYRTYRPSTFDEVAGQQHIVKTLKNALATGKIAHAYLFAGPRGTGKTTMAKIFAKALNCEEGIGHQCNECKNCKSVNDGSHPDVLELDAASNNGVEEIRDLIDKVKYGTILGRYKVYIIDEVHMMTPAAFNALLKTLEEPPEHVIFILATTEPHKILPTILSRCQRYDFSKLSPLEIKDRIKVVLEHEHIEFNEDAVNLIVSLSDGGMRDALSILDQVIAYSGGTLKTEDVLDMFALESKEEMINLLNSISEGNASDVLNRIHKYIARGTDIKRLTNDLLEILKDILVYQTSNSADYLQKTTLADIQEIARKLTTEKVMEMVDSLMNTVKDFKSVASINPLFEVALLKLVSMNRKVMAKPSEIVEKSIEKPVISPVIEEKAVVVEEPKPVEQPVEEVKSEEPIIVSEDVLVLQGAGEESPTHFKLDRMTLLNVIVVSKKDIKNQMLEKWEDLRKLTPHPLLGKAATLLLDGHLFVANNKILVIEEQLQRNVDAINDKAQQKYIQDVVNSVFGKHMFVYAITRNECLSLQKEFFDRKTVGKLPKANSINLEFEGE